MVEYDCCARAEQNRKENIAPVPQASLNFTVNICPISVGCIRSENYDDYLLDGIKLEDLQHLQTVQPSRFGRDRPDMEATVPTWVVSVPPFHYVFFITTPRA